MAKKLKLTYNKVTKTIETKDKVLADLTKVRSNHEQILKMYQLTNSAIEKYAYKMEQERHLLIEKLAAKMLEQVEQWEKLAKKRRDLIDNGEDIPEELVDLGRIMEDTNVIFKLIKEL
jgi:uncharacterized FlgJ-related protein